MFLFLQLLSAQCPIIPTPVSFLTQNEYADYSDRIVFRSMDLSKEELAYFDTKMTALYQTKSIIAKKSEKDFIRFTQLKSNQTDYYELTISKSRIDIAFTTPTSKFYALNSLLQLFQQKDGKLLLLTCAIKDAPKFSWRGLHLDVARHFFTVDEVKRFIDLMAFYKFNKFHWHLTDDQGWRIEIKKYPKLTEIGGFRDSTINEHYNTEPRTYKKEREGGFYTQEDIKEVVAYAKLRSIEVVPEIEMPGHARAALAAYPELSCAGEKQSVPGLWGVFDDIFCSKPSTIAFLKDVLSEVIPLFPSQYVHIGGDEAPKMRWKKCGDCQQIIAKQGLKDEHELQSYFIQQMDDFLTSKGKKLIGWDEILEGGLSTNAAVMSWRGAEGGIEAARQNHSVVMSPTTYCYFDYYQSGDNEEPLAIGGYLPLEKVYEFEAIPSQLEQEKWSYILGGQANLWTEYIQTFSQVEYMVYPRALAISEKLWCEKPLNYDEFLLTLRNYQEQNLRDLKVNYSRSMYATKFKANPSENGILLTVRGIDSLSKTKVDIQGLGDPFSKTISWNDSIHIEKAAEGDLRTVLVSASGIDDERTLKEQTFYLHNGLSSKVDLITKPSPTYSTGGGFTLVDGIKASRPWKGNEWLGFNLKEVEFNIELPEIKKISKVEIGFLDAKGSWIYLPKNIEVFALNSDEKWKSIITLEITEESISIPLDIQTNTLKFKIHSIDRIPDGVEGAGNIPWTFIDEVQITY